MTSDQLTDQSSTAEMEQCGAYAAVGGYKWCSYETGHLGAHSFDDPQAGHRCVAADPRHCRWDACRLCIGEPS